MTKIQIALGYLLSKVKVQIVGETKLFHIDGAVSVFSAKLSEEEIAYLEEAYIQYKLVGVMVQNNK